MKNMKTKYSFISLIFVALIAFSSCQEDFLALEPSDATSETDAFTSIDKAMAVLISMYDEYSDYRVATYGHIFPDVMGDDVFVKASGNYNRYVDPYQYTLLPNYNYPTRYWRHNYHIIQYANQIINNIDGVDGAEAEKDDMKGQAYALRGAAYFNLIRYFAQPYTVDPAGPGVPIRTTPATAADDPPGRSTVQAVYDQIIDDFEAAVDLINAFDDINFMSLEAVYAYLARVNLYMENWTDASSYAQLAYADHALMSGTEMIAGFADENDEWIWAVSNISDDNFGYLMVPSFYDNRTLGYSSMRADLDFLALYDPATDLRAGWFERAGGDWVTDQGGGKFTKFLHRGDWDMDLCKIRSAEMYLIEAEAEANLTNWTEAQDALYVVQVRAIPTAVKSTNSGQPLLDEIYLERRKELIGEGHRVHDICRRNEDLQRGVSAWPDVIKTISANNWKFVFPIPQDEIDANPNVAETDQNPGYN